MSNLKKLLSALLCAVLILSVSAAAFATETEPASADAAVETPAAEEESSGIIDGAALKSMVDAYVKENGLSGKNKVFSIGFCYTPTGDTWYYDADQWCYSASLYKVPCCMLLAEKEYNGEITPDTQIQSQYANGTVAHMEERSLVYSDNYTGHAIVEYLGGTYSGKCAEQTIKFTDLPEDYFPADFSGYSYYSAKYYTQVLKTLYTQSDKFPHIMDYMMQDQAYHYLDGEFNGQYQTAQKYGAFEEKNGNKNYHSAGIVYTPNPVIITIMTKNITGFEKHIGHVAKMLVDYTLQLDSNLVSYQQNLQIAQQQEEARRAQEEQQRQLAEAAAQQAAQQQTVQEEPAQQAPAADGPIFLEAPEQTVTPVAEEQNLLDEVLNGDIPLTLPIIIGLAALALIFLIVFIVKLRKAKMEEEEEYDEEEYEDYMNGDLSDLAPKEKTKKKSGRRFGKNRDEDEEEYKEYEEYDEYEEDDSYEQYSEEDDYQEPEENYAEDYSDEYSGEYEEYADGSADEYTDEYAGEAPYEENGEYYGEEAYDDAEYAEYDDLTDEDLADLDLSGYDYGADEEFDDNQYRGRH